MTIDLPYLNAENVTGKPVAEEMHADNISTESMTPTAEVVIDMRDVMTSFGTQVVHNGISLQVRRAEIFALIGGSGSGKSTLLREMIMLHQANAGQIQLLGVDLQGISAEASFALRQRTGVMFQRGGLFDSLTLLDNVALPLREHTQLPDTLIVEIASAKLAMVGLQPEASSKYPNEISGGMMKRASLARAIALDPELLFLDEPTAGLDPTSAAGVDELVLKLRDLYGLTIVIITHDMDLLWQVADRVAVLADGKVQAIDTMSGLADNTHPAIQPFFAGPRGRAAQKLQNPDYLAQPVMPAALPIANVIQPISENPSSIPK